MSKDLVYEIGTEELPHSSIQEALEHFRSQLPAKLSEARLDCEGIVYFATPRRLAFKVKGLAEQQRAKTIEIRGPSAAIAFDENQNPTRALEGFLASHKLSISQIEVRETEKGRYVFAEKRTEGKKTIELLPDILLEITTSIPFSKPMRWNDSGLRFARPIRWIVALYGDQLVRLNVGGVESGRVTYGHRILSPGPHELTSADQYEAMLEKNFVLPSREKRAQAIVQGFDQLEKTHGFKIFRDQKMLEEVVDMVEWPTSLVGEFQPEFLSLPAPVLKSAMMSHQRYFPVMDCTGRLLPRFVFVSNGDPRYSDEITRGNENVLAARLTDARFFYDEDLKTNFFSLRERLFGVMFHEKLGTMGQKVQRLVKLCAFIRESFLPSADGNVLEAAAANCKNDLVTHMVAEFPDLQGVMGKEYLIAMGVDKRIATAVYEHYLPVASDSDLPSSEEGAVLSIADKIDTTVGMFGIGMIPSGSQDPYGIRRMTIGIILTVRKFRLPLPLKQVVAFAHSLYAEQGAPLRDGELVFSDVFSFMKQRLSRMLCDEGHDPELVEASVNSGSDDVVDILERLLSLERAKDRGLLAEVVRPFERCNNISKGWDSAEVKEELFESEAEKLLYEKVGSAEADVRLALSEKDYQRALDALAALAGAVDRFFDDVLVMCDDEARRANRLSLLRKCSDIYLSVADFARVNPLNYIRARAG